MYRSNLTRTLVRAYWDRGLRIPRQLNNANPRNLERLELRYLVLYFERFFSPNTLAARSAFGITSNRDRARNIR